MSLIGCGLGTMKKSNRDALIEVNRVFGKPSEDPAGWMVWLCLFLVLFSLVWGLNTTTPSIGVDPIEKKLLD